MRSAPAELYNTPATADVIYKYKVRWIEAAIATPCWTSMIVYYAEGDYGHLMTQPLGRQEHRALVKGTCFSFHMPWEDILEDLHRNCSDQDLSHLPREEECVKYMLRSSTTTVSLTQQLRSPCHSYCCCSCCC